ncbi:Chromo domain/shadow [Penicillium paradoxum]|uniref:Chromo domain/shadow n=1 Tax=Penicillium paradoxum TaxID=176176 RepID=UPI002547FABA|nr:Chromo domain/shadow [Penicillium paradoxum]KAJ5773167.1 Chromo domain/shadow [Penicillium paradoxum]
MPPAFIEEVSDEESGDIPFRDAPETNGTDDQDAQEEDDDEEDDSQEEGVYVVESIVDHAWLDDGTLKLLVKWKGYESEKDRTWEEEEGLMYVFGLVELQLLPGAFINKQHRDGAGAIVTAYYKKIGGKPEKPAEKATPAKPGRKRKSMGTAKTNTPKSESAATGAKRQRRVSAATKETEKKQEPTPLEENGIGWLPKGKNWDKDVHRVDTIVKEDDDVLMACLEFNNGHTAKLPLHACYEKCPMKMLAFYEQHL